MIQFKKKKKIINKEEEEEGIYLIASLLFISNIFSYSS